MKILIINLIRINKRKIKIFFLLNLLIFNIFSIILNFNKLTDFSKIINNYNKYYRIIYNRHKNYYNNYYNKLKNKVKNNIIKNNNFSNGVNVAICMVAKQENLYIKEFIDYYKNLGIKKIILYDNNEINGERFNDIINNEIRSGFVKIIDYRGKISPQREIFNNCYENNKYNFDWITFYDVDEYLYLENFTNINDFLSSSIFNHCSSILINWKYYTDNNNIYYDPRPLKVRFSLPFNFSKNKRYDKYFFSAAKSIIKGGLNISWAHFPHFLNSSNICRPNGSLVKDPLEPPQYSNAFIKHYSTKSIEEFIMKLFKGKVSAKVPFNYGFFIFWIKDYFFLFNNITYKKLKLIEKILKFNINKYLFK